jgi:hypothetical protein
MIEIGDTGELYLKREAAEREAAARAASPELAQTHLRLAEHYHQRARELSPDIDKPFNHS